MTEAGFKESLSNYCVLLSESHLPWWSRWETDGFGNAKPVVLQVT